MNKQGLSIVASEHVFNLEFINLTARDMFTERLFYFITTYNLSNPSPSSSTKAHVIHPPDALLATSSARGRLADITSPAARNNLRTPEPTTSSRLEVSSSSTTPLTRTVTNTLHSATENEESNFDSIYRMDSRRM